MKNILYIFILLPILAFGQTQSENYIRTISYKVPTSQIPSPSNVQKVQNIIYYDGLGRPIQKIAHAQSNSGKDIVTHIEYDEFGRQAKDYLPFIPTSGSSLNLKTNEVFSFYGTNNFALSGNPNFETTSNPFSEKQYENSPLNRILKQGAPGNDWSIGSGHEIKIDYLFNSSNEVVNFAVSESGSLIDYGYYSPNLLYKTVTKDENWTSTDGNNRTMHEFKDNLGKVVLKRTFESNIAHDTYYVYNKRGDLSYVLPPMFIENLTFQTTNPLPCNFTKSIGYAPILTSVSGGPVVGGGNVSVIVSNGIIKVVFNAGFNESYINPTAAPIIENSPIQCNLPNMTLGIVSLSNHYYPYVVSIENNRLKVVQSGGVPQNQTMTSFNAEISAPFYQPATSVNSVPINLIDGLCYQYKYDEYNRLVEKKLPGKQWEFIVYDKLDRVVMTGPALSPFTSPTGNGWMITKYDVFSRPILTAWMPATVTSATRKTNQDNRTSATVLNESKIATNTTVNGVGFRYTTTSLPTSGYHVLTVNYYDNYDSGLLFSPAISYSAIHGQTLHNNTTSKPIGLPTVSWVRVPETSTLYKHEKSYTLYDTKGRAIRTYKNNYLGGYTQTDKKLQLMTGRVDFTETRHKRVTADAEIYVKDVFTYTDQERLLTHTHQIGTSGTPQLLAKNEYDELGQLISKQVGGTDTTTFIGLQKVDYSYNIRGWLKGINNIDALAQSGNPTDLFAFKLNYNTVENESVYAGTKLYNGNISETYWRTNNDNVKRKYSYDYDELSRLKNAVYQRPNNSSPLRNNYDERIFYDKNGNITQLIRNGEYDDTNHELTIDYLNYTYHPTIKNRLMKVMDETNSPAGFKDDSDGITDAEDDYTYDDFGNMTKDDNKSIKSISYNHLNLPVQINFGGATTRKIDYLYNATGVKVKKMVTDGTLITETDYLDGYQYVKEGSNPVALTFFPHAEGYVNNTVVNNANVYNYVYNYTDHLGNIRLVYTKDPTDGLVKILEENNYYPFGMKHKNYNISYLSYKKAQDGGINILPVCSTCPIYYKYKYNGKELENELGKNTYAYGWRDYDPAIGRFNKMDRFSEKYHKLTPYGYAGNNPVLVNDIQGDSLWISFGNNERVLYENGNLLSKGKDSKFSAYKGEFAKLDKKGNVKSYKGFLGSTVKALNRLRDGSSFANGIIGTLQGSENNFNIKEGIASFRADLNHSSGRNGVINNNGYAFQVLEQGQNLVDYAPFNQIGSGGDIYWNPSAGNNMIDLGHEMGHAFDADMGMLDSRRIQFNGGLEEIREIRGVYYENRIRQDLGKSLRKNYSIDGPGLLNSSGKPMFIQPPSIILFGL